MTVGLDGVTAKIEHYRKFTVFLVEITITILAIKTFRARNYKKVGDKIEYYDINR